MVMQCCAIQSRTKKNKKRKIDNQFLEWQQKENGIKRGHEKVFVTCAISSNEY